MQVNTNAIVLSSVKYGDTSLIVKCYTQLNGVKSYMLRGVLKNKKGKLKAAYFQPLNQIEITATHNNKGNLNSIKDVSVLYAYESLHMDFKKQTLVYFLSEMLSSVIREEEGNNDLFSYLTTSFQWLDLHKGIASFHIVFLLNLTKFLGFFPDANNSDSTYFDLSEGAYTESIPFGEFLSGNELILFNSVLGTNFDKVSKIAMSGYDRNRLLEIIIKYYELHLDGLIKPRSIQVLKEILS